MMSDIHECIAAFADGEPVDPARLDRALAEAEGRAYLIDLLVLRGLYARRDALPATNTGARSVRLRWLPAVAALVVVSVLGGYVAGRQSDDRVPAAAAGPVAAPSEVTAPAPTQVIRLEPGVDWNERGGGD
ncbi:MAG TPA: hypothetical protein VF424_07290 [Vicinamibacterales bacterium]